MIEHEIERAVEFLVFSFYESGHNPKPVVLHSIKVGLTLERLGCKRDIIIAGILHDLLEDTDVKFKDIEKRFGNKVANLVKYNSFDGKIKDRVESYKENFERCLKAGKEALIIKAADLYENSFYCCFDEKGQKNEWWIQKMKYFIDISKELLKEEKIYKDLIDRYSQVQIVK